MDVPPSPEDIVRAHQGPPVLYKASQCLFDHGQTSRGVETYWDVENNNLATSAIEKVALPHDLQVLGKRTVGFLTRTGFGDLARVMSLSLPYPVVFSCCILSIFY